MCVSACAHEQLSAAVADQCLSTECALPLLAFLPHFSESNSGPHSSTASNILIKLSLQPERVLKILVCYNYMKCLSNVQFKSINKKYSKCNSASISYSLSPT